MEFFALPAGTDGISIFFNIMSVSYCCEMLSRYTSFPLASCISMNEVSEAQALSFVARLYIFCVGTYEHKIISFDSTKISDKTHELIRYS